MKVKTRYYGEIDLDETKVLFIVRNLENDDLMYVSIDNDGYMY